MSIVTTLETVAKANGLDFLYATEEEANVLMDRFNQLNFPALICLPIVVEDTKSEQGALHSGTDLVFYVLTKIPAATIDFSRRALEDTAIYPMRLLGRKFIHALDSDSIIDPESKGIEKVKYTAAYGVLDAHCHGVFGQTKVPFIEDVSVCQ
jgi:hypothetical protein